MQFDNNSILDIIEKKYWDSLEDFTIQCVDELGNEELVEIFDGIVDYVQMDTINEVKVDGIETEVTDADVLVSGDLEVCVLVQGYVHWDRENVSVGSGEIQLQYHFCIPIINGQYRELQLEYFY